MEINGFTKAEILKNAQQEVERYLWGDCVKFKPYLLEKIFGDGNQLIYFSTLDNRPYYWLVLVDSSIDINDIDSEEIHSAIEDECGGYDNDYEPGSGGCGSCSICDLCKDEENRAYPAIASYASPHWGLKCNFRTGEYSYRADELFKTYSYGNQDKV